MEADSQLWKTTERAIVEVPDLLQYLYYVMTESGAALHINAETSMMATSVLA